MSARLSSPSGLANTGAVSLDTLNGAQLIANEAAFGKAAHLVRHSVEAKSVDAAVATRVQKILTTRSTGVPAEFESAWHWAGAWVKAHGVTLPPDTTELRSLRNWFCYQVNMFKKRKLSAKSLARLEHHQIDLALYRAPNTGRGTLMDDQGMVESLQQIHSTTGSYNLAADTDEEMLSWQRRLMTNFFARGRSARMREIEASLAGFKFGAWLRPGDAPVPTSQDSWWSTAQSFELTTANAPAFRGVVDKRTPEQLAVWATQQISAAAAGKISPRQRGELLSLGILATQEHLRTGEREKALLEARSANGQSHRTNRERDLKTFLGAALLARLLYRQAGMLEIYSALGITPHQYSRLMTALQPLQEKLRLMVDMNRLRDVRKVYKANSEIFDAVRSFEDLPEVIFCDHAKGAAKRTVVLAKLLIEVREIIKFHDVRQTIVKEGV